MNARSRCGPPLLAPLSCGRYERLKQEGISFNTITAGKYKRTLTPTKKVDKADLAKLEEDIGQILVLFKTFVADNRPQLVRNDDAH